ncbi:MAG: amidohydrolase [Clostridiales bacterium]|nr:amidohydrolase [Clostridiales bacterium]
MKRTIIRNCMLLDDSAEHGVISGARVAVEDGRIAYAGPEDAYRPEEGPSDTLDACGALALPGLINAHTHVAMALFRSAANDLPLQAWLNDRIWPLEARLDGEAVYWGTMLGIAEMLANGVTAFAEMYFFMDDIARAAEAGGMRASLYRAVIGLYGDGGRIADAVCVHRDWDGAGGGRIRVGLGPHAEYTCSTAVLRSCAERAKEMGCGLHIHVSETRREHEECKERHGMTPAKLLKSLGLFDVPCLLAHGVALEEGDIQLIARSGQVLAHCPGSNLILASGVAPVKRMLDAGVTVALGTDGAASNNNLDVWQEMYLAAVLQKGVLKDATAVTAAQALAMAAEGGAKALGCDGSIGALRPGTRADLILVDTDRPHYWPLTDMKRHLVYSGGARDVVLTMVDGEVLYDRGEYPKLDIKRVRAKAAEAAARLFGG